MSNWIKCSDRLPKEYEPLLCYGLHPDDARYHTHEAGYEDGEWIAARERAILEDVTHWQPLPDAPNES